MKRNPGERLRNELLDRVVSGGVLSASGMGWLLGAGSMLALTRGPGPGAPEWMVWSVLLLGTVFLAAATFKAKRGWPLANVKKGARAEETIGAAIDYALTRDSCAVAHDVKEIAKVGNIDHLVATPHRLWVVETKYRRVPRTEFPEVLRRIARNVEGVREWAPDVNVTGCLVFASEQGRPPSPTYTHGQETIRAFADATALMRVLRDEARTEGGSARIARRVWPLAKVEPA